jgi:hypothetical protein
LLEDAVFSDVTNPSYSQGKLPDLQTIEDPNRIKDGAGVVAEGIKV